MAGEPSSEGEPLARRPRRRGPCYSMRPCEASTTCTATGSPASTTARGRPTSRSRCCAGCVRSGSTTWSRPRTCARGCSTTTAPRSNARSRRCNPPCRRRPIPCPTSTSPASTSSTTSSSAGSCAARRSPYPGGRAVLIEVGSGRFPARLDARFFDVRRAGLVPVLAHPERYEPVWKDDACLEPLLDAGAQLLLDVCALVGKYGKAPRRAAERLLEQGAYEAACSRTRTGRATSRSWQRPSSASRSSWAPKRCGGSSSTGRAAS